MARTLARTTILRLATLVACGVICAATHAQSTSIQIIPAPRQLTAGEGSFSLARDARIFLADNKSSDDQFAAQDFIEDVKTAAGVSLSISRGPSRRDILIGRIDLLPIAQALKRMGAEPPATLNEEGYVIVA